MPTLDLSFTITAIIAICALVSPIITTLINNHHQKVMKQLECQEEEKVHNAERKRQIYENYIRAAGSCVQLISRENLSEFGKYSSQILCYVPDDMQEDIIAMEKLIIERNTVKALNLLDNIVLKLRPILQEL